jgi:LysM repeat protein
MSTRREILTGLLAALISIMILAGSFAVAATETSSTVALRLSLTPTLTSFPTQIILVTQRPGEPTYTPSPTALPSDTPGASAPVACQPPSGWASIIVQPGETLESLAQTYDSSVKELKRANCLVSKNLIPGMILFVPGQPIPTSPPCGPPPGWVYYIVQPGDTLYSIGRARGVSVAQLQIANCLSSTLIRVGQKLYVPNVPTSIPSSTPKPSATATLKPSATWTLIPPSITPIIPPPSNTPSVPSPTVVIPTDTPEATATETETMTPTPTETSTPTDIPPSFTPTDTDTPEPKLTSTVPISPTVSLGQ